MADFLTKYAAARHFRIPLIKAGVNNHAVGADWTPAAGDVKISIDGAAAANVTNLPTAIAMGNGAVWDFSLTGGELTGAQINIEIADAVTKAVEDDHIYISTYGNASAQHAFDLSVATQPINLTQVKGSAAHATTLDNWLAQDISGTASSGTTTTLVDATVLTQADTDYFKNSILLMTSGNLAGQARRITAFNAAAHQLTVFPAFTQAVSTQTYSILPDSATDIIYWNGQQVAVPNTVGVPKIDLVRVNGVAQTNTLDTLPDFIMDNEIIEAGITMRGAMRLINSVQGGSVPALSGSSGTVKSIDGAKNRVSYTIGAGNSRTVTAIDVS